MNENNLDGMKCPECGSYGPFHIMVEHMVCMHDDGSEDIGGHMEWGPTSYIQCPGCLESGIVRYFTEETS